MGCSHKELGIWPICPYPCVSHLRSLSVSCALSLSLLVLASGCDSADPPSANLADRPTDLPSKEEVLSRVAPHTLDGFLLSVAEAAPGFAGVYIEDGTLQIAVAESRAAGRGEAASKSETYAAAVSALRALAPDLFEDYELAASPRSARYAFDDVTYWRHVLADRTEGLRLSDSDERRGVAAIGVATEADVATLRGTAARLNIPEDGIRASVGGRVERASAAGDPLLQSHLSVNCIEGGDKINIFMPMDPLGRSENCTYGAMVYRGQASGSPAGFITNPHCTTMNGLVGGVQGNHYLHSGDFLGVESFGPDFQSAPVSSTAKRGGSARIPGYTRPFRYSDAAFIDFDLATNASPLFGRIVRTATAGTTGPGSSARVGAFEIVGNADSYHHLLGATVQKMGQVTNRTVGDVYDPDPNDDISGSCFDYVFPQFQLSGQPDPNYGDMLVCQNRVQAFADQGDSGGPVFVVLDELEKRGSQPEVRFQGLIWARSTVDYIYSPYGGVNHDLKAFGGYGALVTH